MKYEITFRVQHDQLIQAVEVFLRHINMVKSDESIYEIDLGMPVDEDGFVEIDGLVEQDEDQPTLHDLIDPSPVEEIPYRNNVIDMADYRKKNP